ncbi:hypothetical protein Mterra_02943 [Calidithermus terrae]|uniref:Uncharacterized protein n=1 Tax=Calidithermus terrae TaxID=1408545 RepID=A0A399EAV6_9DEIN|nr:hypothetical protein [Calidithermus terrae]RIH81844.1 hypothetical protein Mterra_02943 [Calidithermus terrae]
MLRLLLILVLLGAALAYYAEQVGLGVGYPPFVPMVYWKYNGEQKYSLRVTGVNAAVKVKLDGQLNDGALELSLLQGGRQVGQARRYKGRFNDIALFYVNPGLYTVRFRLQDAKGYVRMDWVGTRFEY